MHNKWTYDYKPDTICNNFRYNLVSRLSFSGAIFPSFKVYKNVDSNDEVYIQYVAKDKKSINLLKEKLSALQADNSFYFDWSSLADYSFNLGWSSFLDIGEEDPFSLPISRAIFDEPIDELKGSLFITELEEKDYVLRNLKDKKMMFDSKRIIVHTQNPLDEDKLEKYMGVDNTEFPPILGWFTRWNKGDNEHDGYSLPDGTPAHLDDNEIVFMISDGHHRSYVNYLRGVYTYVEDMNIQD